MDSMLEAVPHKPSLLEIDARFQGRALWPLPALHQPGLGACDLHLGEDSCLPRMPLRGCQ